MGYRNTIKILLFIFLATGIFFHHNQNIQAEQMDITNKLRVELEFVAERFSDNKIEQTNPQSEVIDLGVVESESNGRFQLDTNLGTKSDEREGCTQMVGDRRTGKCQDGIYKFEVQSYDAAGNENVASEYSIERDTVKPNKPSVSLFLQGYTVYANISGEAGAEILIDGTGTGDMPPQQAKLINMVVAKRPTHLAFS